MVAVKKGSILKKACKLNRFICIQREVLFQEVIDTWFEYKLQEMHSSSNSFKRLMHNLKAYCFSCTFFVFYRHEAMGLIKDGIWQKIKHYKHKQSITKK